MADDEQRDDGQPAAGEDEVTSEAPEVPEGENAEGPATEESTPAEPEAESQAEAPEPEAPEAADEAEEGEEGAPEGSEAAPSAKRPAPAAKESDKPPGAELEPIKIEPQRELSAEERARAEAEATAEAGEEPVPAREPAVELPTEARIQATGKRKRSIARVVLRAGSGSFEINRRGLEDYFPRHQHQTFVRQPLVTSGYDGKVDVRVRVHGGGIAGQAGAVRHGIARALTEIDPDLRGDLKRRGLLTRDARAKERRKAGLKKARKRPQFSKR